MQRAESILGSTVKDRITGFSGVATSYTTYLTGCNRVGVTPTVDADGKTREDAWFDEQRLDVIADKDKVVLDNSAAGFGATPRRQADPPAR
ncbi:hypothetical protein [Caulobacter sp. Root343]|uniref:hypothetical protein n=1 Tax=Caulobacter sp. Root343 TaxID=1736520 RepID=UPI0006F6C2D7|nr:hypothetical protein [Caulobacter sp. Root343]KQV66601.1 hypothetical protein ASC70_12265 [Caulobacter sp. Root343]